jgi:hypothetical protein
MTPLPPGFELPLPANATGNAAGFIAAFAANPFRARRGSRAMAFPAVSMMAPVVRRIVVRLVRSSR